MKLERLAVATTVLALGVGACAANRSKEVKHAEANLTSAQVDARNEEARLNQKQAQEQASAQRKAMSPGKRAELQTKQLEQRAETKAKGEKEIAKAQEEATTAHAEMQAERATVEADAKERLAKADARIVEAKSKSAKLSGGKRAQYDAEINTFNAKKIEAQDRLSNLSRAPDEEWSRAKGKLDKTLDDLEAALKRAEKDL
jgi:hypothetical protein